MFLYGMNAMGDGLAKLSGGKLEQILEKLTSKRIMAVLLGVAVTAASTFSTQRAMVWLVVLRLRLAISSPCGP